eukprot:8877566-Ditylum_brightwellii.AAC.1
MVSNVGSSECFGMLGCVNDAVIFSMPAADMLLSAAVPSYALLGFAVVLTPCVGPFSGVC